MVHDHWYVESIVNTRYQKKISLVLYADLKYFKLIEKKAGKIWTVGRCATGCASGNSWSALHR